MILFPSFFFLISFLEPSSFHAGGRYIHEDTGAQEDGLFFFRLLAVVAAVI